MDLSSESKEIAVVEIIHAANGKTYESRAVLRAIVPISQKEPCCLYYQLFEPIAGSSKFLVFMRWESLNDLRVHEASSSIQKFVQNYDKVIYGEVTQSEWFLVQ